MLRRRFLVALALVVAGAAAGQETDRHAALERAYAELVAARQALLRAEAERELGIEPAAGERLGIVGGGSRLAPEYWERQKRLEEDVALAHARLDKALARWNELR